MYGVISEEDIFVQELLLTAVKIKVVCVHIFGLLRC